MNVDVVKNLEVLFLQWNSTNIIKKVIDFKTILHYFHLSNQEIDGKKEENLW